MPPGRAGVFRYGSQACLLGHWGRGNALPLLAGLDPNPHNSLGNYLGPCTIEPYYRSLIDPFKEPFKGNPKIKAPIVPLYYK